MIEIRSMINWSASTGDWERSEYKSANTNCIRNKNETTAKTTSMTLNSMTS
jgi:hypothetical protein